MPAVTLATPSDFEIDRSPDRTTVSVSVALSLPGVGSDSGEDVIEAVLATVAPA